MERRVINKKYVAHDGTEYDSRDEYLYHQKLLADDNVSSIHRQVKLALIPPRYMLVPKQLKTKVRWNKRLLVAGHNYKPDFIFREGEKFIICDVKSTYTRTLREFRITEKACINKIMAHNRKRHGGVPVMVFREAIKLKKNQWRIVDYPPIDCHLMD